MANEYVSLKSVLHILDLVIPDKTIKRPGKAIRKRLKEIPTADAVEVVRCKDCQHARQTVYGNYHCLVDHRLAHEETDYCSYGERKEGAEE